MAFSIRSMNSGTTLCLETIDKYTSEALAAEGFTDIDHDTLCAVLERDTLRIREAKLFNAVVRSVKKSLFYVFCVL